MRRIHLKEWSAVVLPTDSSESKSGEGFACRQRGAGNYRVGLFSPDGRSKSHQAPCCNSLSDIFADVRPDCITNGNASQRWTGSPNPRGNLTLYDTPRISSPFIDGLQHSTELANSLPSFPHYSPTLLHPLRVSAPCYPLLYSSLRLSLSCSTPLAIPVDIAIPIIRIGCRYSLRRFNESHLSTAIILTFGIGVCNSLINRYQ